ncbi:hypothetical protein [Nonomuraea dietziae]|uniref:hypothetical protein n=1 Tax=Nonomuraea dietziae TaxID=65515 RepID=UPI0031D06A34
MEAEPRAAEEIARLCGGFPLALRIAGARLVARPDWSLSDLAVRLADATRRLDLGMSTPIWPYVPASRLSHQQLRARNPPGGTPRGLLRPAGAGGPAHAHRGRHGRARRLVRAPRRGALWST